MLLTAVGRAGAGLRLANLLDLRLIGLVGIASSDVYKSGLVLFSALVTIGLGRLLGGEGLGEGVFLSSIVLPPFVSEAEVAGPSLLE